MAKKGQQQRIVRRKKLLRASIHLFLKYGYEKTTTVSIAEEAGIAPPAFFTVYDNKEELLLDLVKIMFSNQFENAGQFTKVSDDPVLLYSIETSLLLYITELSEPLREVYVLSYSLPNTSEYIYSSMPGRLQEIFSKYMPDAKLKDFYEMEIASAGIMRAYMAKPCDLYFTIKNKIMRFLQSSLTLYSVPKEVQAQIMDSVFKMDLRSCAEQMIQKMAEIAENDILLADDE